MKRSNKFEDNVDIVALFIILLVICIPFELLLSLYIIFTNPIDDPSNGPYKFIVILVSFIILLLLLILSDFIINQPNRINN